MSTRGVIFSNHSDKWEYTWVMTSASPTRVAQTIAKHLLLPFQDSLDVYDLSNTLGEGITKKQSLYEQRRIVVRNILRREWESFSYSGLGWGELVVQSTEVYNIPRASGLIYRADKVAPMPTHHWRNYVKANHADYYYVLTFDNTAKSITLTTLDWRSEVVTEQIFPNIKRYR